MATLRPHSNADVLLKISKEGGVMRIYHLLQQYEQPQLIAEGLIAINVIMMHLKGNNKRILCSI